MIDMAPSEDPPLIQVERLTMRFGHQTVLKNIDMSVPAGETLALIGESGCGKSVLVKTLVGLLEPVKGTVHFDGHNMHALTERELAQVRQRLGYVFQNAALFDSMTVGQNVAFPLEQLGGFARREIREQVLERLNEVGLPSSVVTKSPA